VDLLAKPRRESAEGRNPETARETFDLNFSLSAEACVASLRRARRAGVKVPESGRGLVGLHLGRFFPWRGPPRTW